MSANSERSTPTDDQLTRIARFIARACLEVERGLRPPDHLTRLSDPATTPQWNRPPGIGRFYSRPVLAGDIGPPHLSRIGTRTVYATVVTRTEGDHWGALTFRLDGHRGRWHPSAMRRLLPSTHRVTHPEVEAKRPSRDRITLAIEDWRMAAAAMEATTRRLAELRPGMPGYDATRTLVQLWDGKVAELDRELTDIHAQLTARQHVQGKARS